MTTSMHCCLILRSITMHNGRSNTNPKPQTTGQKLTLLPYMAPQVQSDQCGVASERTGDCVHFVARTHGAYYDIEVKIRLVIKKRSMR